MSVTHELAHKYNQLPLAGMVNDLRTAPGVHSSLLEPGAAEAIDFPTNPYMVADECITNHSYGITQEPVAVIKTGMSDEGDVYSVIRVTTAGGDQKYALAHMGDGAADTKQDRAQLVGIITDNEPLRVGRNYGNAVSANTSREHFIIGLSENGAIRVGSSGLNGTEVLTSSLTTSLSGHEGNVVIAGFKGRKQETRTSNPLEGSLDWSVKTASLVGR